VRLRLLQPLGLGELENTLKLRGAMAQAVAAKPLVNLSMTSTTFLHISSDLFEGMSTCAWLQCACMPSCFKPKLIGLCRRRARPTSPGTWLPVQRRLP
jgi:hypothetical protein